MTKTFVLGLALTLALAGSVAADAQQPEIIMNVEADDAEMNAAKVRAVETLPDFYRRLPRPARANPASW